MTTTAAVRSPTRAPAPVPALLDRSFLYVTGKGGAGKTTVAAALGLAAAARGRRTVVCDLAGSDQLARAYGCASAHGAIPIADRLWSLSVDPQEALEEWLRRQPGGAAAVALLTRSAAFAHFVAGAPGAKELVTIGKTIDLARPVEDPAFGLVVADAPSTGHALSTTRSSWPMPLSPWTRPGVSWSPKGPGSCVVSSPPRAPHTRCTS
jgi:hypothetical protein